MDYGKLCGALVELPTVAQTGEEAVIVQLLYRQLGVTGLVSLEEALLDGRASAIGSEKCAALLKLIENNRPAQIPLGVALPAAHRLVARLKELDPTIISLQSTGELRRGEENVEQISLVACSEDTYETLEAFLRLPEIATVTKRRDYKAEVVLKNGLRVEFITCFPEQFATTLAMTTGTDEHRAKLRDEAWKRNWQLSLGGFIRGEEIWPARDEEEVFRYLGLPYLPPEVRLGQDEFDGVKSGELNLDLVLPEDLRGDLHCHSKGNLEELARTALRRGYRYLLVADRFSSEKLKEQRAEIFRINELLAKEGHNFTLLAGAEVEIGPEGDLSLPDEILAELDLVVAALHSGLNQDRKTLTARLLKALRHPQVDILAHPTGRITGLRPEIDVNFLKIFVEARESSTVLEINGHPDRLDLGSDYIRQALAEKVKLIISSGAHSTGELAQIKYGVISARRGGARPIDILNTHNLGGLRAKLKP